MFDHSFSMSCMVLRPNKSNAISFASSARTLVMGVCAGNLNTWKQHFWDCKNNKYTLLCSWGFSRYSAPIHWLAHGHMTSNNAKTTTSNVKQFTVTREMLTAVARYQRVQLKVVWCCRANLSAFFKICFCFVLFCYLTNHLMTGTLGNSEFCVPRISLFPSTSLGETFSGNKIHCSPRDQSLSIITFVVQHLTIYCVFGAFRTCRTTGNGFL